MRTYGTSLTENKHESRTGKHYGSHYVGDHVTVTFADGEKPLNGIISDITSFMVVIIPDESDGRSFYKGYRRTIPISDLDIRLALLTGTMDDGGEGLQSESVADALRYAPEEYPVSPDTEYMGSSEYGLVI